MSAIQVKHLYKSFQSKEGTVDALKDISLQIESGDIFGIIGMSGAGKSTLVRCLNYLEKPTSGDVIIDQRRLGGMREKELRKERRKIAMIFQHFNLLMQKNVLDNVCFPLKIQRKSRKEAKARALELLRTVGLEEKAKAYPAQLSGGQKQRVAIARALASDPKILLCDEATSALDPQTTESILQLLQEINRKLGITIVIITHQMSVIREICHRVAIIENGVLAEEGRVEDIFTHPRSAVAKSLIFGNRSTEGFEGTAIDKELPSELHEAKKLRIVFSENSAFEPVVANMILKFAQPVNILRADTKNVGGIAKGQMILGLPDDTVLQEKMQQYLLDHGLDIEEVTEDVD